MIIYQNTIGFNVDYLEKYYLFHIKYIININIILIKYIYLNDINLFLNLFKNLKVTFI